MEQNSYLVQFFGFYSYHVILYLLILFLLVILKKKSNKRFSFHNKILLICFIFAILVPLGSKYIFFPEVYDTEGWTLAAQLVFNTPILFVLGFIVMWQWDRDRLLGGNKLIIKEGIVYSRKYTRLSFLALVLAGGGFILLFYSLFLWSSIIIIISLISLITPMRDLIKLPWTEKIMLFLTLIAILGYVILLGQLYL